MTICDQARESYKRKAKLWNYSYRLFFNPYTQSRFIWQTGHTCINHTTLILAFVIHKVKHSKLSKSSSHKQDFVSPINHNGKQECYNAIEVNSNAGYKYLNPHMFSSTKYFKLEHHKSTNCLHSKKKKYQLPYICESISPSCNNNILHDIINHYHLHVIQSRIPENHLFYCIQSPPLLCLLEEEEASSSFPLGLRLVLLDEGSFLTSGGGGAGDCCVGGRCWGACGRGGWNRRSAGWYGMSKGSAK